MSYITCTHHCLGLLIRWTDLIRRFLRLTANSLVLVFRYLYPNDYQSPGITVILPLGASITGTIRHNLLLQIFLLAHTIGYRTLPMLSVCTSRHSGANHIKVSLSALCLHTRILSRMVNPSSLSYIYEQNSIFITPITRRQPGCFYVQL